MVEINGCVVVIKQTAITEDRRAARFAGKGDKTAERLHHAHKEHNRTVEAVRSMLSKRRISYKEMAAHSFSASEKKRLALADLVITIGGDGTVLGSSHYVRGGLLLGVNSAPLDSIGHFCFTDRRGFAESLGGVLSGALLPTKLSRLAVRLDEKELPELALNDVLVVHECPAATTRYLIGKAGVSEEHRSSGLWVSTAAGSTAGIRSAGGRKMPLRSRRIQYLVRELYRERDRSYVLVRGMLDRDDEITIASKMPQGRIYIDGSRTVYRFPFGMRAKIRLSDYPLNIFVRQ